MNAMVAVRANATGLQSPPPAERAAAASQVASSARAKARAYLRSLGILPAEAASAKSAPNAAALAKSASATGASATGASATGASTQSTATRAINNELGKEAFLQLLVFQMQNQDPLEPMDNAAMISQLAQFSALEQMSNLNTSFGQLDASMGQLSLLAAGALVGKQVTGTDTSGVTQQGTVERIIMDQGVIYFGVGDVRIPLASVQRVE